MPITSFYFFVFCAIAVLAYKIMPPKYRWFVLFIFSIFFYLFNAPAYTGIYWMISVLSVYFAGLYFGKSNENRGEKAIGRRMLFWLVLILNISMIILLKYSNFCIWNINAIGNMFGCKWKIYSLDLIASLGISYYTFQLIGYLCDTYWGIIKPQKNILKLFLFGCYFPQMVSGPISRYSEISDDLYAGNSVEYNKILGGVLRVLWGLFKKLVVAGRLGSFVTVIYDSPHSYSALYIWIATFAFSLQLYADFSGCIDMISGVSECFGIRLPDNFNSPFFSQSIQEFWQKWHITLGAWFKTYVMYPFLDTKLMINVEGVLKKYFGKRKGKRYTSYIGMLLVWFGIGLWHGSGWKFIIGEGLWHWIMIVSGKELKPYFDKLNKLLKVNTTCFSWKLFRSLRTFFIFSVGMLFFRANSLSEAFRLIYLSFSLKKITAFQSIIGIGLDAKGWFICLLGLATMLMVDYLHTRGSVREMFIKQNIIFQWIIFLLLIFAIIIWGQYGPGYNASEFIYQGF